MKIVNKSIFLKRLQKYNYLRLNKDIFQKEKLQND